MKLRSLFTVILLALVLALPNIAESRGGSFGGSRSGGGSSFGGSRSSSSSFGGSRSSSFGGSRSAPSTPSKTYSTPTKSSSFGGNRSTSNPAPIVRPNRPSTTQTGTSGGTVTHNYYGGNGGYYGGGNGFYHGMMLGYLWNRPQTVYIGGQNVVVGSNGQPMYDENGQPVIYENSHPFLTFLGTLMMLAIIGCLIYLTYKFFTREA